MKIMKFGSNWKRFLLDIILSIPLVCISETHRSKELYNLIVRELLFNTLIGEPCIVVNGS
jgi:hypothetical protein